MNRRVSVLSMRRMSRDEFLAHAIWETVIMVTTIAVVVLLAERML